MTQRRTKPPLGQRRSIRGVLGLIALLTASALQGWSTPSDAAACPSSGGSVIADAPGTGQEVSILGHGLGHGLGMSQYGANGAAALGCGHRDILETYYPGAGLNAASTTGVSGDEILVNIATWSDLTSNASQWTKSPSESGKQLTISVSTTADAALGARSTTWRLTGCTSCSQPPAQSAGTTRHVVPNGEGGFQMFRVTNGVRESNAMWVGGQAGDTLALEHDGAVVTVRPEINGTAVNERTLRWGHLQLLTELENSGSSSETLELHTRQRIMPGLDVPGRGSTVHAGIERYLWGLHEVSSSFEPAAQRAQAVAARTYAMDRIEGGVRSSCQCHVVTTPADQNYTGWSFESQDNAAGWKWRDQVLATAQKVMTYEGDLITALYSSSHGGHSESPTYVWGTTDPGYLQPVDDSRWDLATDTTKHANPYRSWAFGFSRTEIADQLGLDEVDSISVAQPVGAVERHDGIRVTGVKNGAQHEEFITGWDLRQSLGLHSPNFTIDVGLVYSAVDPARILDTRTSVGGPPSKLGQGKSVTVQVAGKGGVPSTGAAAVVLNVTATRQTATSYLTVYPTGTTRPLASNLNFVPEQVIANLVTVPLHNGKIDIYNNVGETHLAVDVAGYYADNDTGATYEPLTPRRLLDTRDGTGGTSSPVGPDRQITFQVAGRDGIPSSGVTAVAINATAVSPTASTYLTLYPDGAPLPATSTVNAGKGTTVPNMAITKLGSNGRIRIYNNAGDTNVVIDVMGYFTSTGNGSLFHPVAPARVVDTREGTGGPTAPIGNGEARKVFLTGAAGVPTNGVAAVVANVTGIRPTEPTYLTVYPTGTGRPIASNLNLTTGQVVPNHVITPVATGGDVRVYNDTGHTDIAIDIAGYFTTN